MFQPILDEIQRAMEEIAAMLATAPEPWTWWQRVIVGVLAAVCVALFALIIAVVIGGLWQANRAVWGF